MESPEKRRRGLGENLKKLGRTALAAGVIYGVQVPETNLSEVEGPPQIVSEEPVVELSKPGLIERTEGMSLGKYENTPISDNIEDRRPHPDYIIRGPDYTSSGDDVSFKTTYDESGEAVYDSTPGGDSKDTEGNHS